MELPSLSDNLLQSQHSKSHTCIDHGHDHHCCRPLPFSDKGSQQHSGRRTSMGMNMGSGVQSAVPLCMFGSICAIGTEAHAGVGMLDVCCVREPTQCCRLLSPCLKVKAFCTAGSIRRGPVQLRKENPWRLLQLVDDSRGSVLMMKRWRCLVEGLL